jgi:hypothetical protein
MRIRGQLKGSLLKSLSGPKKAMKCNKRSQSGTRGARCAAAGGYLSSGHNDLSFPSTPLLAFSLRGGISAPIPKLYWPLWNYHMINGIVKLLKVGIFLVSIQDTFKLLIFCLLCDMTVGVTSAATIVFTTHLNIYLRLREGQWLT